MSTINNAEILRASFGRPPQYDKPKPAGLVKSIREKTLSMLDAPEATKYDLHSVMKPKYPQTAAFLTSAFLARYLVNNIQQPTLGHLSPSPAQDRQAATAIHLDIAKGFSTTLAAIMLSHMDQDQQMIPETWGEELTLFLKPYSFLRDRIRGLDQSPSALAQWAILLYQDDFRNPFVKHYESAEVLREAAILGKDAYEKCYPFALEIMQQVPLAITANKSLTI